MLHGIFSKGILQDSRKIFLIFCIVVAFLIADTMINYVSDLVVPYLVSGWSIAFFTVMVFVYAFGQYALLGYIKKSSEQVRMQDSFIRLIHKVVTITQYALLGIIIVVVCEILFTTQYHTISLTATSGISQILTIVILSLFALRFFSWYKSNRNSIVVLLYGLSLATAALALAIVTTQDLYLLPLKNPVVTPESEVVFPYDYIEPGSVIDNLFSVYEYISLVSFGLLIFATAVLLYHYSKKLGKIKYWIIITLPLLYNVSMYIDNFGIYTPSTDEEWFYWWLYISLNSTAGGILFGLAFMTVAKTIRHESLVRQYMRIAAYGFILMFISNQVTLIGASYPPYAIVTMSLLPFASYMIFLGLYSTAVSVSQDNHLRKSIKKYAKENSNLLGSIGTAQMEQEIQKTVTSMKNVVEEQEKALQEQTGIEANLEEDEMKTYLEEVMQEVGKSKKPPT
jgi:hypothetical protein